MPDVIKDAILPSGLIMILSMAGSALLITRKTRRFGVVMLFGAGVIYAIFANVATSFFMLRSLENRYPCLDVTEKLEDINEIVVLAGYGKRDAGLPLSSQVNSASLYRVCEALRIAKLIPGAEVLVSGADPVVQIMADLLVSLGVEPERIRMDRESANTYESAVNVKKRIPGESFILVTSAVHMPRAMLIFQDLDMDPIPAPTGYQIITSYRAAMYLPSPFHLGYSDIAVYEYLAILWYKVGGRTERTESKVLG
jgi:uncharacterized SAM-binding protein YcdF (DUF218 family)